MKPWIAKSRSVRAEGDVDDQRATRFESPNAATQLTALSQRDEGGSKWAQLGLEIGSLDVRRVPVGEAERDGVARDREQRRPLGFVEPRIRRSAIS